MNQTMNNKINFSIRIFSLILLFISLTTVKVFAEDLKELVNLKGEWKFSIGDNPEWSKTSFDHAKWQNINVPRNWEAEGFSSYNGYAWYRKDFYINTSINEAFVYLHMGYIDDADEVYVNGHLVGSTGDMQPTPKTAFNVKRVYPVPVSLLNIGQKNTIAVRVYDFYEDGGIVGGQVGLYLNNQNQYLEKDLSGYWLFETEDEFNQRQDKNEPYKPNYMFVPAYWDSYGYDNFDGKARYTKKFNLNQDQIDQDLFVVLGFIDDIEVVYINNKKIGSIIEYEKKERTGLSYDQIFRGYAIPKGLLYNDKENTLAVVVFDKGLLGGIYKGPIGIATASNFKYLKELNFRYKSSFEIFMESFWK